MKKHLIGSVLIIVIGICLVDSKVLPGGTKRKLVDWGRGTGKLSGMAKLAKKVDGLTGGFPTYGDANLDDAVRVAGNGLRTSKLKGRKALMKKMGGFPTYGAANLKEGIQAIKGKLKRRKIPLEKIGGFPKYGGGNFRDAVTVVEQGLYKDKLQGMKKKLGGQLVGFTVYGSGNLVEAGQTVDELVNKGKLRGRKLPMKKTGGEMRGFSLNEGGQLRDVEDVPLFRGKQQKFKGMKRKWKKLKMIKAANKRGGAHFGDEVKQVEEVIHVPSSACSCSQQNSSCDASKAPNMPRGMVKVILCHYHQDTGCLMCSRKKSDDVDVEVMGTCCASTNLARDLMKVDSDTDSLPATYGRGGHHNNCTTCQVYRDDGTGRLVKTTIVDERALGGQCGLFPGLPDPQLQAYYKSERCKIILQGTACSGDIGNVGGTGIDGALDGDNERVNGGQYNV